MLFSAIYCLGNLFLGISPLLQQQGAGSFPLIAAIAKPLEQLIVAVMIQSILKFLNLRSVFLQSIIGASSRIFQCIKKIPSSSLLSVFFGHPPGMRLISCFTRTRSRFRTPLAIDFDDSLSAPSALELHMFDNRHCFSPLSIGHWPGVLLS